MHRFSARMCSVLLLTSLTIGCSPLLERESGQGLSHARQLIAQRKQAPLSQVRARVASFQAGRDKPLFYFGPLDTAKVDQIRAHYQLVVIEPTQATSELVARLKSGQDEILGTADDVVVLGYFSAGEDARTLNVPDADIPKGDGTGPRIDPRPGAPFPDGNREVMVPDAVGRKSPAGVGYASYYLDDVIVDGIPDRNRVFGGAFVNAGDPRWFEDSMDFLAARDRVSGLREILTPSYGNALNCDGIMLDTFDTPAPNHWTDETSSNQTEYEWTAAGYLTYVQRLRETFPDKVILVNRGLAFFNPELTHYRYNFGGFIDLLLFESFYSDSDPSHGVSPFWEQNRYIYAPRLNAEADRPLGFRVISLGYKPGLWEEELKAVSELGWIAALANPALNVIHLDDLASHYPEPRPPRWDTTVPDTGARVGIQQAVPGRGQVTLRWDVANAENRPVRYNLYFQAGETLDFTKARKVRLSPNRFGPGYDQWISLEHFPYEDRLTGLAPGTYTMGIRAEDSSTPPLEEKNSRTLTITVP